MKILTCVFLAAVLAWTAAAADVTGKWSGSFDDGSGNGHSGVTAVLKQSGGLVTGTAGPGNEMQWKIIKGTAAGNKIMIEVKDPDSGAVYHCDLMLSGESLKGEVTVTQPDGGGGKGKLDLTRMK